MKNKKINLDGISYCPDSNTCCELVGGIYGCCPASKLVLFVIIEKLNIVYIIF
jgi:hypothetical protein